MSSMLRNLPNSICYEMNTSRRGNCRYCYKIKISDVDLIKILIKEIESFYGSGFHEGFEFNMPILATDDLYEDIQFSYRHKNIDDNSMIVYNDDFKTHVTIYNKTNIDFDIGRYSKLIITSRYFDKEFMLQSIYNYFMKIFDRIANYNITRNKVQLISDFSVMMFKVCSFIIHKDDSMYDSIFTPEKHVSTI